MVALVRRDLYNEMLAQGRARLTIWQVPRLEPEENGKPRPADCSGERDKEQAHPAFSRGGLAYVSDPLFPPYFLSFLPSFSPHPIILHFYETGVVAS